MGKVLEALSCMKPVTTAPAKFDSNGIFSPYSASSITWHGQIRCKPNQSSALPYFSDRALLADAVYRGYWDKVKTLFPKSREKHHQVWVNCWRIRECLYYQEISPWDNFVQFLRPRQWKSRADSPLCIRLHGGATRKSSKSFCRLAHGVCKDWLKK